MTELKEMPATREGKLDHYLEARYALQVSLDPDPDYLKWLDGLIYLYSVDRSEEEFKKIGLALLEWGKSRQRGR